MVYIGIDFICNLGYATYKDQTEYRAFAMILQILVFGKVLGRCDQKKRSLS